MKRRSFLLGAGTVALAQMVVGCRGSQGRTLKVRILKDSIPAQLLNEFRRSLKQQATVKIAPEVQLKGLFENLQTWQEKAKDKNTNSGFRVPFIQPKPLEMADLVTLGDYWLAPAIEQKLIQPLPIDTLSGWQQLPQQWQALVRRNNEGKLDSSGQVWGAPYRWGSTVIAYRKDKFDALGWTPTDWADLWREELRDRISILDNYREAIGLTLKRLGSSYNTQQLDTVPNLKETLLKLHQQVKLYSSNNYLQPLVLGDTWLAVGWSSDVLPLIKRDPQIAAVIPQSGTALWTDVWVQPTPATDRSNSSSLAAQWIDFCWQPNPANAISLFTDAASPTLINRDSANIPEGIGDNPLLLPPAQIIEKSEFLSPLPEASEKQYRSLWQEVRSMTVDS